MRRGSAISSGWRLRRLAAKSKWTTADAREVFAAQAGSGLSVAAFTRRLGIGGARLGWWRTRVKLEPPAPAMLRVHVREEVAAVNGGTVVEVVVGGGRIVRVPRGFDAGELSRIVAALESGC